MATVIWNGNGDWTGTPGDWSTGTPPGPGDTAVIQTGTDTLSSSASVAGVRVIPNATLTLANGASLTTTGQVLSSGTLNITGNGDTVNIGGVLDTLGTTNIGTTGLSASATVTAAGLQTSGSLVLQGNTALSTTSQATLNVTGATSPIVTGTIRVLGDADLQLNTGLTTIGTGGLLQLEGVNARVSLGANTASTALTGLSKNSGTFDVEGNGYQGAGGTSVTTTTAFANSGSLQIDTFGSLGGSSVQFGGVLTNTGTAAIGNTGLGTVGGGGTSTLVTVTGLVNQGTLSVLGNATSGTTNQATLKVTGASSTQVTGTLLVGGDADLALATALTSVGYNALLEIDGSQARVSSGLGATNSALTGLATNLGTFRLRGGTSYGAGGTTVTTSAGFSSTGSVQIDSYGNGDGGSTFVIGGTLTNSGANAFAVGNSYLSASTLVKATGLSNTASLYVIGNNSGSSSNQATLQITGAVAAVTTGVTLVGGNADLAVGSGITSVGSNSTLEIDGSQARVSSGLGAGNSALTGLSSNAGIFRLRGNTGYGLGGTTVTTGIGFSNTGTMQIDSYGNGDGGSTLTLGGTLVSPGSISIGNNYLSASTTVSVAGLISTNYLVLAGSNSGSSSNQATLKVTGSSSLSGYLLVEGNADLALNSAITTVGYGSTLEIDGSLARISSGLDTANSALTGLSSNAGYVRLRGNTGGGAGGTTVATNTTFNNSGTLQVDGYGNGDGGSTLTIGGTLVNGATVNIGNNFLSAATTVTATGLANNAVVTVRGNNSGSSSNLATLQIAGPNPAQATGYMLVGGDADLALATALTSIGTGATLEIDGSQARVSTGLGATNSGVATLATNAGYFRLRGNTGEGAGGTAVTTSTGLTNNGSMSVDGYGNGDGGSTLTIGGALANANSLIIGNSFLSGATTVTATNLINKSAIYVVGNNSGSSTNLATLQITSSSAAAAAGFMLVGGNADVALTTALTSISSGATLEIDGSQARVSTGLGTTNSALTGLASNAGYLRLRGDTGYGAGGTTVTTTTAFTNTGAVQVDGYGNGDGGSTLTFGGTLFNSGSIGIGNYYASASVNVTAGALSNSGIFSITDVNTANLVRFTGTGTATNTGTLYVGGNAKLTMNGSSIYNQQAGSTTVAGTLVAATINDTGGLLDFKSALTSGNGTGAIQLSGGATLQFDAAVDSSHTITLVGNDAGTLKLTAPGSFAGVISGFAGSDAIDLVNTAVTGLSYAGTSTAGTLTVTNAGGTAATLAFKGSYTTSSFNAVSDGNGGTLILDPPATTGGGTKAAVASSSDALHGSANRFDGQDQHQAVAGTTGGRVGPSDLAYVSTDVQHLVGATSAHPLLAHSLG